MTPPAPGQSSENAWSGMIPAGTPVALLASRRSLALLGLAYYEVALDGDLVLVSRSGSVATIAAGHWVGVGSLEYTDGHAWIALDNPGAAQWRS